MAMRHQPGFRCIGWNSVTKGDRIVLETLISQYGVVAILVGAGIEGETVAFLGGVFAHRHLMPYWQVAVAAAIGSFIADQIFFLIGRAAGQLESVQRVSRKPAAARVRRLLEKHPTGFILAFRFIYGMRTISPVVIGISRVPALTFIGLNAVAAVTWGIVVTGVGYLFGGAVEALIGRLELHQHLIVGVVAAGVIVVMLAVWGHRFGSAH